MKIKNVSSGARLLQVKGEGFSKDNPVVDTVTLAPNQERDDLELVNPNDRVFKGMVDNGELVVDGAEEKATPEELQKRQEARFRSDPHQIANREAAEIAGRTPGMADPLPEGTDTQGDATSEAARRSAPGGEGEEEGSRRGGSGRKQHR